jgi:hypothetical protein
MESIGKVFLLHDAQLRRFAGSWDRLLSLDRGQYDGIREVLTEDIPAAGGQARAGRFFVGFGGGHGFNDSVVSGNVEQLVRMYQTPREERKPYNETVSSRPPYRACGNIGST